MQYISIVYCAARAYCFIYICGCRAEIRKSNQRLNNIMVAEKMKKTMETSKAIQSPLPQQQQRQSMIYTDRAETRYWGIESESKREWWK